MKTYSPTARWISGDYTGEMEEDENGEWVEHEVAMAETSRLASELERLKKHAERTGELLRDWLAFTSDVVPGCAAGADWLESLRKRTEQEVST